MRCPQDPCSKVAFCADAVATFCAIVGGIGKAHTVMMSGDDCGSKFSDTFAFRFGLAAMVFALIAECIALTYCSRHGHRSSSRNKALLLPLIVFIAYIIVLYNGAKYKEKEEAGGGGDSITCVISHPYHLYVAASLSALHILIFFLVMAVWPEEDDDNNAAPSHGGGGVGLELA